MNVCKGSFGGVKGYWIVDYSGGTITGPFIESEAQKELAKRKDWSRARDSLIKYANPAEDAK